MPSPRPSAISCTIYAMTRMPKPTSKSCEPQSASKIGKARTEQRSALRHAHIVRRHFRVRSETFMRSEQHMVVRRRIDGLPRDLSELGDELRGEDPKLGVVFLRQPFEHIER